MDDKKSFNDLTPKYPFRILHIFFVKVNINRQEEPPSIDKDWELALLTEVGFVKLEQENNYHINLKVSTTEIEDIPLQVEIVTAGLFEYIGDNEPDEKILCDFVNEHLLVAMASRVIQLLGTLTAQMGMSPIWLPSPRAFGFEIPCLEIAVAEDS